MDDVNYNIKKSFTIGKFIFGSMMCLWNKYRE